MQYAVVQKERTAPTADQLKRALKSLTRFTDADAVRLAKDAYGILVKNLSLDEAQLLQKGLHAEGIPTELVPFAQLPKLPVARSIKRMEIQEQALVIFDPLGRTMPVPWKEVTLISGGALRHFEMNQTRTQEWTRNYNPVTGLSYRMETEVRTKIADDTRYVIEIILTGGAMRFEIELENFLFKFVCDRDGLNAGERMAVLAQRLAERAPHASLNRGALASCDPSAPAVHYSSRNALAEESVWLLWRNSARAPAVAQ